MILFPIYSPVFLVRLVKYIRSLSIKPCGISNTGLLTQAVLIAAVTPNNQIYLYLRLLYYC